MSLSLKLFSFIFVVITTHKSTYGFSARKGLYNGNLRSLSTDFTKMSAKSDCAYNWNFLDDVYLITTTNKENLRLEKTQIELESVDLNKNVQIRTFKPDDDDRVRGCYTSHISVLQEIQKKFNSKKSYQVLVLEDNLEKTFQIQPDIVDSVNSFIFNAKSIDLKWDIFHLAYMMYVPNLTVAKLTESEGGNEIWSKNIVQIFTGNGSSIGTSAYIISKSGVDAILKEHTINGYKEAIPNIMASLFPTSRYGAYPMIFHRAAKIGSLVNPQLDSFRKVMFSPFIYSTWEKLLVGSGLQTNKLFPLLLVTLTVTLLSSIYSFISSILFSNSDSISNGYSFDPIAILATTPLLIALWGATLFTTNKGFAPSAQKK